MKVGEAREVAVEDNQLLARSSRAFPGGAIGHLKKGVPDVSQFYERGEGCRVWDVDGNEYIDFMCSYGPIVLGHHCKEVDDAAMRQMRKGDTLTGPTRVQVELAEKLISLIPGSSWVKFAKNGTDVTSVAVRIARATTKKRVILRQTLGYHGASSMWMRGTGGVIEEDHAYQIPFKWNNLQSVKKAIEANKDDFAGIIVSAFDYRTNLDCEMPTEEFARGVRALCDEYGALLILDDVRAGFRVSMKGTWSIFGIEVDMTCFSKAIANGYSLSALVGNERTRNGAASVYATGSFWSSAVSLAAALETIQCMEKWNAIDHMNAMGRMFTNGLQEQAKKHGLQVKVSGPPAVPFMSFVKDTEEMDNILDATQRRRGVLWCNECAKRGVILHPGHNWFISYAHKDQDIRDALKVTDEAFRIVSNTKFPAKPPKKTSSL